MASEKHEAIRAPQIKQSAPYTNHKPSDPAVHVPWIYALRQKDKDKYPISIKLDIKNLVTQSKFQATENYQSWMKRITNYGCYCHVLRHYRFDVLFRYSPASPASYPGQISR
jgi:hypothetical protein